MSGDDVQANGHSGVRNGAGGMVTMMIAMWIDPSAAESEEFPPRFTTATLLLWTLIGIALTTAIAGINFAISGKVSPSWLVATLAMFVPLLTAFMHEPPRRLLGLAAGVVAGSATGAVIGGVASAITPTFWAVFSGLATGALIAAFSFGLLTREHSQPSD